MKKRGRKKGVQIVPTEKQKEKISIRIEKESLDLLRIYCNEDQRLNISKIFQTLLDDFLESEKMKMTKAYLQSRKIELVKTFGFEWQQVISKKNKCMTNKRIETK